MDLFSPWHLLLILIIVFLLFGAGRIPRLMGDMAKGVKAFKAGMREDEQPPTPQSPPSAIESEMHPVEHRDTTAKH